MKVGKALNSKGEFDRFIRSFPELTSREIFIISHEDSIQRLSEIRIIPVQLRMLAAPFRFRRLSIPKHDKDLYLGVFIYGRITINDSLTALIVNRESMYFHSAFDLNIVDVKNRKILERIFLADAWGDAGFNTSVLSSFTDLDGDGCKDIVTRFYSYHPDYTGSDDRMPGMLIDSVVVRRFSETTYVKTSVFIQKQHALDCYPRLIFDSPAQSDTMIFDHSFPQPDFAAFRNRTKKHVYPQ